MKHKIDRRHFLTALTVSSSMITPSTIKAFQQPTTGSRGETQSGLQVLEISPGYIYELDLSSDDGYAPGTQWIGGRLVSEGNRLLPRALASASPLQRMYAKRVIWKLDDLADWCFDSFQRYCTAVENSGAKANIGINPGSCNASVFDWLRELDKDRFELWNHTWDHGSKGPRQTGLPYDTQLQHLLLAQEKVREELGVTMRAFGPAGIRPFKGADYWISDGDDVTYYVIRNHPDFHTIFGASSFADEGKGRVNSDGILTLPGPINMEQPDGLNVNPESRDHQKRYLVEAVRELYPEEDPHRPSGPGNADEVIWRMEHPFAISELSEFSPMDAIYLQCHPWNWDYPRGLETVSVLAHYVESKPSDWRWGTVDETYRWLRDKELISLEKISPMKYRLNAFNLHHNHKLELVLPKILRTVRTPYLAGETQIPG